jgi:2-dehydro-3-deoxygluconokinase
MNMSLKPAAECRYQCLALGEVMLRLDPGDGRIRTAREFRAWEGGGEYNVARGLRRCFGLRTAIATALVDNEIGRLIEDLILQGGVETDFLLWRPTDGIGRRVRNGLNFTERGFGLRGPVGVPDRGHSAASQLALGDFDWEHIFGQLGVRVLHTGGIFAGLSESTTALTLAAVQAAKKHGTLVSYDLNFRPSLWQDRGGAPAAQAVNEQIMPYVDVLLGNEYQFDVSLGHPLSEPSEESFGVAAAALAQRYPQLRLIAGTQREEKSASAHDWAGLLWADGDLYRSIVRPQLAIYDRIGGGDSFASGLLYGVLSGADQQRSIDYAAAHGALAMTTPGDTSMATLTEVEALMTGAPPRVRR